MAFVRVKTIKGNRYGYLVENTWQPKGSRQQVKAYLGKIVTPTLGTPSVLPDITAQAFPDAVLALASWTLANHGFSTTQNGHAHGDTSVSLAQKRVTYKGKNAVLELHEGFLCNHTLQQVLDFVGEGSREEEVGKRLANTLLEAGLSVPQDAFVSLFNKIFKPLSGDGL